MGQGEFETMDLFICLVISVYKIIAKVLAERSKRLLTFDGIRFSGAFSSVYKFGLVRVLAIVGVLSNFVW